MLESLGKRYGADGHERRIEAVAERMTSPGSRAFCYRLAAAVAFVDDYVAVGEISALDDLAKKLELTSDQSQKIMREVHEVLSS